MQLLPVLVDQTLAHHVVDRLTDHRNRRLLLQNVQLILKSEDGFLTGMMAKYQIRGMQELGCIVVMKHFALNDQESQRKGVNTWANEQTIREIYLPAFQYAVEEENLKVMMDSFNRLGTKWCGASEELLVDVLRTEWGFDGYVISDCPWEVYMGVVDALLAGVSDKINEVELTTEQKLEKKSYFPKWNDLIGESAEPEFNFQHGDDLFEVLQLHTFSAEWVPGEAGTESLYKKVSLHEGSKEDPIPWEPNMQLYQGKYYTEAEVLYLCTRDSGIPLNYSLAKLVDQYVAVVNEEEPEDPAEADGSKENPIPYEYAKTVLVNGKYYTQDGVKYLCKRDAGMPLSYNLADLVSAGYVDLINE